MRRYVQGKGLFIEFLQKVDPASWLPFLLFFIRQLYASIPSRLWSPQSGSGFFSYSKFST